MRLAATAGTPAILLSLRHLAPHEDARSVVKRQALWNVHCGVIRLCYVYVNVIIDVADRIVVKRAVVVRPAAVRWQHCACFMSCHCAH